MGCNVNSGILEIIDGKKVLTKKAKEKFINEVQDILKYGTEGIPEQNRPFIEVSEKIPPNPNPESIPDLKNETIFSSFHKNYIGRYEKFAIDTDLESTFSLAPIAADPIALSSAAFNVELPAVSFPDGFTPYFSPTMPQKLLADLISAGNTELVSPDGLLKVVKGIVEKVQPPKIPDVKMPEIIAPTKLGDLGIPKNAQKSTNSLKSNSSSSNFGNVPLEQEQILSFDQEVKESNSNQIQADASDVLLDLTAKEFSIVENIPKLLSDIIGKIPNLILKLSNPKDLMQEVSKTVSESGVMGASKSTSSIEKAADAVLAKKISEMVINASLASTIGTAPGGVATGLIQTVSSPDPYVALPNKIVQKPRNKTPGELAVDFANQVKNTSYGSDQYGSETRRLYLNGLFKYESVLGEFPPEAKINVYGDGVLIDSSITPLSAQERSVLITRTREQTGHTGEGLNHTYRGRPFYFPIQNLERILATPVEDKTAFYKYAEYNAKKQSSCGMFLRACYFAAGCNNRFFLSLYPNELAIAFLMVIGALRNYRWVEIKDESGNVVKRGMMNDYLDKNNPAFNDLRDLLNKLNQPNHPANIPANKQKNQDGTIINSKAAPYEPQYFLNYWANDNYPYINFSDFNILEPYLKPIEERAIYFHEQIKSYEDQSQFPELKKGDGIILAGYDKATDEYEGGREHALLITTDRPRGYEIPGLNKKPIDYTFTHAFNSIEGGSPDPKNLEPRITEITDNAQNFNLTLREASFETLKKRFPSMNLDEALKNKIIKIAEGENFQNKAIKFNALVDRPLPTAIVEGKHDIGLWRKKKNGQYNGVFFMGTTRNFYSSEVAAKKEQQATGKQASPTEKLVYVILKVDSYCDPIENGNEGTEDQKAIATKAIQYMDNLPFLKDRIDEYFHTDRVTTLLAHYGFPREVDFPSFGS